MADLGQLSTQYRSASRAASVIDQAVEELRARPVGRVRHNRAAVGGYLASIAGLIDPALARQIDAKYVNAVPKTLVANFRTRGRRDPGLSIRLVETADSLKAGRPLGEGQVKLVEDVAEVATQDAIQLSQKILAP